MQLRDVLQAIRDAQGRPIDRELFDEIERSLLTLLWDCQDVIEEYVHQPITQRTRKHMKAKNVLERLQNLTPLL